MKITPDMIEDYDYIKCRVCGKYFKSLVSHVMHKHDMDPEEYKQTFDVGYVVCKRLRQDISDRSTMHTLSDSEYVPRNKEQVVAELKKYAAEHKPLERSWLVNNHKDLFYQVKHIFGDFETLKQETGIVIEKAEMEEWSKDQIIEEIRDFHKKGDSLSHGSIKQADPKLLDAAKYHFGSWGKALEAAGFDYSKIKKPQRKWSREKIIEELQKRYKVGKPVNAKNMKKSCGALYSAASKYIGPSWQEAIELAGLDWSEIKCHRKWDCNRIIEAIQILKKKGKPLYAGSVIRENVGLYLAGRKYFGSWEKAVVQAAFDASEAKKAKKWDKSKVITTIKESYKKGISLRYKEMNRAVPGLYHAGLKYFGLWKKAIEAAGIDGFQAKQLKKWDKNKIIKGIKKRNKTGSPLNSGAVQQADNNLISAAIRHFGSWKKAIEAAGFDYSKIRKHERKWNREKVIKEIQKIYKHGKPVNCASIKKSHNSLFNAAVRYIGPSWQEAIELAGLDWSEIRKLQEWDRKRIIKAIQILKKKGKSLYQSDIRKDDYALYLAGWRYFSSWGKALEEAGFDASKARKNKQWSKSKIIQAIKEYHKKGIPLNIVSIKKADPKLLDAAKYHFGSWGKALEEAGFDASEIRKLKKWSKSRNPGTQ